MALPIVASGDLLGAISRGFKASETARESSTVIRHDSQLITTAKCCS